MSVGFHLADTPATDLNVFLGKRDLYIINKNNSLYLEAASFPGSQWCKCENWPASRTSGPSFHTAPCTCLLYESPPTQEHPRRCRMGTQSRRPRFLLAGTRECCFSTRLCQFLVGLHLLSLESLRRDLKTLSAPSIPDVVPLIDVEPV